MINRDIHVLRSLSLPDRFENLRHRLGDRVAELLVEPGPATLRAFRVASQSVSARGEGSLAPIVAPSGAGKTTLASSLSGFLPGEYAPTVSYAGPVDYEALVEVASQARNSLAANDNRIIPLNFDHRESAPPNANELATIKRFLRAPSPGSRCLLVWPEVSEDIAGQIAKDYMGIAGTYPFAVPIEVDGPDPDSWVDIALNTLQLANEVPSIEDLGISPQDYNPDEYETIGAFMRRISNDFAVHVDELLAATQRPLSLAILYVSESYDAGVLSQLTSGTKYGLLDSRALIDATPNSSIGRWWAGRRGLLTQSILKLNARAFCFPPATTVAILRRFGDAEVTSDLRGLGVNQYSPSRVHEYIARSDLGKYIKGSAVAAYEARGRPAEDARAAIQVLAEKGFTYGRDKPLNEAMLDGIRVFLEREKIEVGASDFEKQLSFCPLIPDNSVDLGSSVMCLEYTWRSGNFLSSGRRSEVAQYALSKLKSYAVELGWIGD